jgi:hypothetical protein
LTAVCVLTDFLWAERRFAVEASAQVALVQGVEVVGAGFVSQLQGLLGKVHLDTFHLRVAATTGKKVGKRGGLPQLAPSTNFYLSLLRSFGKRSDNQSDPKAAKVERLHSSLPCRQFTFTIINLVQAHITCSHSNSDPDRQARECRLIGKEWLWSVVWREAAQKRMKKERCIQNLGRARVLNL